MATLYKKIEKMLESEEVCIIAKKGAPQYAVMPWENYQALCVVHEENIPQAQEGEEDLEEANKDIDINTIPV